MGYLSFDNIQTSIDELEDLTWDVIVIGAGPSGGIAALQLAMKGQKKILLLDKDRFPREKICGEALTGGAMEHIQNAGLENEIKAAAHFENKSVIHTPRLPAIEIPRPFALIKREVLDGIIARRAVENGACFAQGNIAHIETEDGEKTTLSIKGSSRKLTARIVIIATGTSLSVPRKIGAVLSERHDAAAIRSYVRSTYKLDHLIGAYDFTVTPGYGWIFPMGENMFNVGWISFFGKNRKYRPKLKSAYKYFMGNFPVAKEILSQGEEVSPPRAAPLRWGLKGAKPVCCGNILNIGDVIGATLPLTGEGLSYAMQTGEYAAGVVHEALIDRDISGLDRYDRWIKTELHQKHTKKIKRWAKICHAHKDGC